jgi:hypothetical protein
LSSLGRPSKKEDHTKERRLRARDKVLMTYFEHPDPVTP